MHMKMTMKKKAELAAIEAEMAKVWAEMAKNKAERIHQQTVDLAVGYAAPEPMDKDGFYVVPF